MQSLREVDACLGGGEADLSDQSIYNLRKQSLNLPAIEDSMVFLFLLEPGYHLSGFLHMIGFNVAVALFLLDFQKALYGMSLSPEHSVTKCPIAGIFELCF